jgi:hypothetical protein
MTEHEAAHYRNLIDIHRRIQDPLVIIKVDHLQYLLDRLEPKPRVKVKAVREPA